MLIDLNGPLDTLEIERILKHDPYCKHLFLGVFALNELPLIVKKRPSILVFNFSNSWEEGSHWGTLALNKDEHMSIFYFESFGLCPLLPELVKFFKNNGSRLCMSTRKLQSEQTTVCGIYACLFAIMYAKSCNIRNFYELFSLRMSRVENDAHVQCLLTQHHSIMHASRQRASARCPLKLRTVHSCRNYAAWRAARRNKTSADQRSVRCVRIAELGMFLNGGGREGNCAYPPLLCFFHASYVRACECVFAGRSRAEPTTD